MMKILETKWGRFPQVDHLNPKFIPQSTRLKVTLEIDPNGLGERRLEGHIEELAELFPSFTNHRCENEHGFSTSFRPKPGLKKVDFIYGRYDYKNQNNGGNKAFRVHWDGLMEGRCPQRPYLHECGRRGRRPSIIFTAIFSINMKCRLKISYC